MFSCPALQTMLLLCTANISFQIRLKKEQEEKEQKRKEKAEAHLYTIIKVTSLFLSQTHTCLLPRCIHKLNDVVY